DDYLVNLKDCANDFQIARKPKTVAIMRGVDRGKLSVHAINNDGQLVVLWQIELAERRTVRINVGKYSIEPPPDVDQVILQNAGVIAVKLEKLTELGEFVSPMSHEGMPHEVMPHGGLHLHSSLDDNGHFNLFRRLSTRPDLPLPFRPPNKAAKLN